MIFVDKHSLMIFTTLDFFRWTKKASSLFQRPWNVSLIIFTLLYARICRDIQFGVIVKRLKRSYDNSNLTRYTYLATKKNWRIFFITSYLLMLGKAKDGNVSVIENIDQSF